MHLELTTSLSAEETALAFRRFSARRGPPKSELPDNNRSLVKLPEHLTNTLCPVAPKRKFIAPRAQWWGGFWERLVKSVKSALKKTLGQRCMSRGELETILNEIEARIKFSTYHFCWGQSWL